MLLIKIKKRFQVKIQALLGVSQSLQNLERRIENMEHDLQELQGQQYDSSSQIIWREISGSIEQYEEEMARLEKVFAIYPDKLIRIRWYCTNSSQPEYIKISN